MYPERTSENQGWPEVFEAPAGPEASRDFEILQRRQFRAQEVLEGVGKSGRYATPRAGTHSHETLFKESANCSFD